MKNRSKTSLFLMELILSILLFSVCSAVCVQLFVQARQTAQKARDLAKASLLCDSIAAVLQDAENPEALFSFFPGPDTLKSPENSVFLWEGFYDAAWQPCAGTDAVWILFLTPDPAASDASSHTASRQALLSVRPRTDFESLSGEDADLPQKPFYELHIGY